MDRATPPGPSDRIPSPSTVAAPWPLHRLFFAGGALGLVAFFAYDLAEGAGPLAWGLYWLVAAGLAAALAWMTGGHERRSAARWLAALALLAAGALLGFFATLVLVLFIDGMAG